MSKTPSSRLKWAIDFTYCRTGSHLDEYGMRLYIWKQSLSGEPPWEDQGRLIRVQRYNSLIRLHVQPDFDDPKDVDLTIEDFDLNWLLNGGAFVEMMQSLRLGAQLDRPAVTAALKNKGQTTHAAVVLKGFWRVVVKNGHEPYRWRLPNQPGGGRAGDTAGARPSESWAPGDSNGHGNYATPQRPVRSARPSESGPSGATPGSRVAPMGSGAWKGPPSTPRADAWWDTIFGGKENALAELVGAIDPSARKSSFMGGSPHVNHRRGSFHDRLKSVFQARSKKVVPGDG